MRSRMVKLSALSLTVVLLLSLCACIPGALSQEETAARLQNLRVTTPTCNSSESCELAWSAARDWVLHNAGYRIQLLTPDYLETYGSPSGSPDLSVRVQKQPLGSGRYQLVVTVWCGNMFGCAPNAVVAAQRFNDYVNAVLTRRQ